MNASISQPIDEIDQLEESALVALEQSVISIDGVKKTFSGLDGESVDVIEDITLDI